jgi:urea transporter
VLGATFVSPKIGLMSLLGVLISNYSAHLLKFETSKIESGFYGFNGILFGAATVYYYQLSPLFLLLIPLFIVITFLIAAVLENHLAVTFNLPGLSLPFIISLFIYLIFLSNYQDLVSNFLPVILSAKLDNPQGLAAEFPVKTDLRSELSASTL